MDIISRKPPTLAQVCQGRDNNFNLIRFVAALAVAVSHATVLTYGEAVPEPLFTATGYTLGHHGVNVFFIVSGFLICQSYLRAASLTDFATARLLRIFPNLIFGVLLVVFVLAPLLTTVPMADYWQDRSTWFYLFGTSTAFFSNLELTGFLTDVPFANRINVPLWTLKWELMAYFGVPVLGVLCLLRATPHYLCFLAVFVALWLGVTYATSLRTDIAAVDHILRLGLCFKIGIGFYLYRRHIPLHFGLVVLAWLPVWLLRETLFYQLALFVALAYSVFWLAYIPAGKVRLFNKMGDYSYGIYIFHFPLMQAFVAIFAFKAAHITLLATLPILLSMAVFSYHVIEKPAMSKRRTISAWLTARRRMPAT